jgi:hypothetical protein
MRDPRVRSFVEGDTCESQVVMRLGRDVYDFRLMAGRRRQEGYLYGGVAVVATLTEGLMV